MHFSGGAKDWLLIVLGGFLLLAALLLPLRFALADDLTQEEQQLISAFQKGELIRIHVVASSDQPEDQALKIKVRDALIDAFGAMLKAAGEQSSSAVFELLTDHVDEMETAAVQCAAANGFTGSVHAEVGLLHLPAKQYGSITLPEGEYRALCVIIGEGRGQNWWCVLYPQLCLALADAEEDSTESLLFSSKRIWDHWFIMGY